MINQFCNTSLVEVAVKSDGSRQYMDRAFFTAPYKIMKPFVEGNTLTIMLLSVSAGVMEGDTYKMTYDIGSGCRVKALSQSYEKIHKMNNGYAKRDIHITVHSNAYLDYSPLPVIPFKDSDFRQNAVIELEDETSVFIMSDILTCGRYRTDERFEYKNYTSRVYIKCADKVCYLDNTIYKNEYMDMNSVGIYEGYTHLASMVAINIEGNHICEKINSIIEDYECKYDITGGVTELHRDNSYAIKILGKRADRLLEVIDAIKSVL